MGDLTGHEAPEELEALIMAGLMANARGEDFDEDVVADAAGILAVTQMVAAGIPVEVIEQLISEREWSTKVSYEGPTGQLSVSLVFEDEPTGDGETDG